MDIPRHWRLKAQRYRLEGTTCQSCGQLIFPPRPVCTKCYHTTQLTRTTIASTTFEVVNVAKMWEETTVQAVSFN